MKSFPFETPMTLSGPFRHPRQMLEEQEYDGLGVSIHDDAMAQKLGLSGAPIEGPTHFSQFEPLLARIWGKRFYEQGCISAHFRNMVVEGEEVKASIEVPPVSDGEIQQVRIFAEKKDGTPVLEGTASLGPDHQQSELDRRFTTLRPPEKLVILRDMKVGDRGSVEEIVAIDFGQHLGNRYPFSLAQKLELITEQSPWHRHDTGKDSPWGRPVLPYEMISVLTQYTVDSAGFKVRSPHVDLFADLEIRMIDGPVFTGEKYLLEREVVFLSETRRTESYWLRTLVRHAQSGKLVASTLLNYSIMKNSFPGYEEERNG